MRPWAKRVAGGVELGGQLERHLGVEIKIREEFVKNSGVCVTGVYEKDQEDKSRDLELKVPKGCGDAL